jgi:hypothetical protein
MGRARPQSAGEPSLEQLSAGAHEAEHQPYRARQSHVSRIGWVRASARPVVATAI